MNYNGFPSFCSKFKSHSFQCFCWNHRKMMIVSSTSMNFKIMKNQSGLCEEFLPFYLRFWQISNSFHVGIRHFWITRIILAILFKHFQPGPYSAKLPAYLSQMLAHRGIRIQLNLLYRAKENQTNLAGRVRSWYGRLNTFLPTLPSPDTPTHPSCLGK